LETVAFGLGLSIDPNTTYAQLCDAIDAQLSVAGIAESPFYSLPTSVLANEILRNLIDDPESLANLCSTSNYFLRLCRSIPFNVPGDPQSFTLLDYASSALLKCILYAWLFYIESRMFGIEIETRQVPPYKGATLSDLYMSLEKLNSHSPEIKRKLFVCSEEEAAALAPERNLEQYVPLYGTGCPSSNKRLLPLGAFWFPEEFGSDLKILAGRERVETDQPENVAKESYNILSSSQFKTAIVRDFRSKYDTIIRSLFEDRIIRSTLCQRFWLPDIVAMDFYVSRVGNRLELYIDVLYPEQVARAFQDYFSSLIAIV
jgi:hypothetical protein